MNDEKAVAAVRSGSGAAIGAVMDKYSRLLWSVAGAVLSGVGTEQDAEECVADTFIYLWEHPEKYEPGRGGLKTWLAVIARTKALDRCRALSRQRALPLEDVLTAGELGVAESLLEREARAALRTAVAALGEPEREILLRRYYYDQKPREIALALNMSVKQVDNQLYRTKLRLRETLEA